MYYNDAINHKGEKLFVNRQLQKNEVNEYKNTYIERIEFEYKGIEIYDFIRRERIKWYNLVELFCNAVDKLGEEKFGIFKSYFDEIYSLSEDYIIVDDKVYKPFNLNDDNIDIRSGELILYHITMTMSDNKILDGRLNIDENGTNPFLKQEANKDELIDTLRYRVINYFKDNKILPNERHLQKKLTLKLNEMLKWLDNNEYNLRWLYEK
ncbi:hypothetical protein [Clostridium tyrobutyricum]|jgi:hypothetical protein|uniref:hypothetical protein n=1 Tax=Clostridium tyrobutyricum TaxID=1519 RepID=UPI000E8E5219|nr:hypothetical protein [Clostridium tyrobutyricum]HBN28376.1 hypothetical protein [Clostridiaceae bacterium]